MAAVPASSSLSMRGLKTLTDQSHAGMALEGGAIGNGDSRRFLAAVLLGEKGLISQVAGIACAPDAEDAALFLFLVFFEIIGLDFRRQCRGAIRIGTNPLDGAISQDG